MEKKDFQEMCKDIFKRNAFICRGTNFYFDTEKFLLVFGLQHSRFGKYYYIEYGIADKAINECMPWPKVYQVGRERRRVNFQMGKTFTPTAVFYGGEFEKELFTDTLESIIKLEKELLLQYKN